MGYAWSIHPNFFCLFGDSPYQTPLLLPTFSFLFLVFLICFGFASRSLSFARLTPGPLLRPRTDERLHRAYDTLRGVSPFALRWQSRIVSLIFGFSSRQMSSVKQPGATNSSSPEGLEPNNLQWCQDCHCLDSRPCSDRGGKLVTLQQLLSTHGRCHFAHCPTVFPSTTVPRWELPTSYFVWLYAVPGYRSRAFVRHLRKIASQPFLSHPFPPSSNRCCLVAQGVMTGDLIMY